MKYSKRSPWRAYNIFWSMASTKYKFEIIVVCVLTTIFAFYSLRVNLPASDNVLNSINVNDIYLSNNRIGQYCNKQKPAGSEGSTFADSKSWKLNYVAATIRHGDRSAIHTLPNSKKHTELQNNQHWLDSEAASYNTQLKSFKIELVRGTERGPAENSENNIKIALDPGVAFRTPDLNLTQGQLTTRGFMQHVLLGSQLSSAYGVLMSEMSSNRQIYVRSTKYVRTVQSVAGLMMNLLPASLHNPQSPVAIHVLQNEEDEVMHGVGLRTSVRTANVSSHIIDMDFSGSCEGAAADSKRQKELFVPSPSILQRVVNIFGSAAKELTLGEVADASVPSMCHGVPLPCATDGSVRRPRDQQCLVEQDLSALMAEADRHYCERYTGTAGGRDSTNLAIYPFMKEIMTHIVEGSTAANGNRKLSLFSGHDTVIAPVLAALGVYHGGLCRWPSYAAHVVFEVWQPAADSALFRGAGADNSDRYVRVLYDGVDITQSIPTCRDERLALLSRTSTGSGAMKGKGNTAIEASLIRHASPLCSLRALQKQIDDLIAPHDSLKDACIVK